MTITRKKEVDTKNMAYSKDLRERVITYLQEGHTQKEAKIIFKVGTTTIKNWLALISETGSLAKRPLERSPRIYGSEKLNAYIEENPDALLKDISEEFKGSISGAFFALEREKITLKKRQSTIRKETKQNESNLRLN